MRKHNFAKCLLSGAALIASVAFQSCQSKPTDARDNCSSESNVDSSCEDKKDECDEWKKKRECNKGCKDEEASDEAMIHMIEIDHPENESVSQEEAPLFLNLEVPTEAALEVNNVPEADLERVETETKETAAVVLVEELEETGETVLLEEELLETLHSTADIDS